MKYKVGDKVRIREDLEVGKNYGHYNVVEDMGKYKGKEFIINEVSRSYYRLKNENWYCWTDEMLEPVEEGEKNTMELEKLNEEYKNKMDKLMEEYKAKVKEVKKKEEPFIEMGQEYFCIDSTGFVCSNIYSNNLIHQRHLNIGNCFPYTEKNKEQVEKKVKLIAERRKLQSEMEMFAKLNNEEEIDWNDDDQLKWCLYIRHNEIIIDYIGVGYYRGFNTTYFSSVGIAKKALEKFGDRIKKLYMDMEEN